MNQFGMRPCRVCKEKTPFFHELYGSGGVCHLYMCKKHMDELNTSIRIKIESMMAENGYYPNGKKIRRG